MTIVLQPERLAEASPPAEDTSCGCLTRNRRPRGTLRVVIPDGYSRTP